MYISPTVQQYGVDSRNQHVLSNRTECPIKRTMLVSHDAVLHVNLVVMGLLTPQILYAYRNLGEFHFLKPELSVGTLNKLFSHLEHEKQPSKVEKLATDFTKKTIYLQ